MVKSKCSSTAKIVGKNIKISAKIPVKNLKTLKTKSKKVTSKTFTTKIGKKCTCVKRKGRCVKRKS